MYHGDVVLLKDLRRNNGVGDSRFVFQAEEDKSFCGARALTCDYGARYSNELPIWDAQQIRRSPQ